MVSIPHAGTDVPEEQRALMTDEALRLPDTDWFVPRLYDVPELKNAALITANVSRYVIDLNRPPSDENLYPGQNTTRLCPETNFDGSPVYRDGKPLSQQEIQRRIEQYWRPYHDKLGRELDTLRAQFGFAVLIDLHSIASRVPNLFPGGLPDLNFGTNRGLSAGASFQTMIEQSAAVQTEYSAVVNGRFVGGFITRHYGDPERQIHAVQLELSQATYLKPIQVTSPPRASGQGGAEQKNSDESIAANLVPSPPPRGRAQGEGAIGIPEPYIAEAAARWDDAKAAKIQIALRQFLRSLVQWTAHEISRVQS